jgi:hypothetical protein
MRVVEGGSTITQVAKLLIARQRLKDSQQQRGWSRRSARPSSHCVSSIGCEGSDLALY